MTSWPNTPNPWFTSATLGDEMTQKHPRTNAGFFGAVTPESAYVLGLLATDGCVYDGDQVILSQSGDDGARLLRAVQLRTGGALYQGCGTSKSHRNSNRLILYGKPVVALLAGYGVMARKTFTMKFPAMPKECLHHYVRGLMDGDGCVASWTSRGRATPVLIENFSCASTVFVTGLLAALKAAGVDQPSVRKCSCADALSLTWACMKAVRFLGWVYQGATPDLLLVRKYRRFLEHLKLRAGVRTASKGPALQQYSQPALYIGNTG